MNFVAALLAPLALLLPAAGAIEPGRDGTERVAAPVQSAEAGPNRLALPAESVAQALDSGDMAFFQLIARSFQAEPEYQVRIEQRMTIRIAPRPQAMQPNMLMDLPTRPLPRRFAERDGGRCLPIAGIAGVEVSNDNRLILYMRDRRVLSAGLERSCSARDYYSGFYVERNSDGQICVKRDNLLSRSGANCKLSRIRQLVEAGN
jgi:hypothetical protein